MKLILIIISSLLFSFTFGQKKTYNVFSSKGDTTFWYKYINKEAGKLSLIPIISSTSDEYFRIWTDKQIIDIWKDQRGETYGKLISWADEYVLYDKEIQTDRTFTETKDLNTDTVRLIKQLLISSKILDLPTDDSIKGWQKGFDGIVYIIEHSTKDTYSLKSYWTPTAQKLVKEAPRIQTFIDSTFNLVNAKKVWSLFSKEVPYESYINGGPLITSKILTKKEKRIYAKERKNYLKNASL